MASNPPACGRAAEALSETEFRPRALRPARSLGTGRSLPNSSDGMIAPQTLHVHEKDWTVYTVGGTPAQAVLHGVLEIVGSRPALVVSGINYGENVGTGVTVSGTVGAALEAATLGIPSMAVSLQVPSNYYLSYSREIDFSAACHFTQFFGRLMLENHFPADVDILKVDIPENATTTTPWEITRQSRHRY